MPVPDRSLTSSNSNQIKQNKWKGDAQRVGNKEKKEIHNPVSPWVPNGK